MKTRPSLENMLKALTVVSFVLLCWVVHRALQTRNDCVTSSFISRLQIEGKQVPNCRFESRLSLSTWNSRLSDSQRAAVRAVEVLEPLSEVFRGRLFLAVEITDREGHLFDLGRGYVRLSRQWLADPLQLRRALAMGVLKHQSPHTFANQFQLEVIVDFLLLAIFNHDEWLGEGPQTFSLARDMKFSTTVSSFEQYCLSPFRSLSHHSICQFPDSDQEKSELVNVWGLRPLLAVGLWRIFDKLPLRGKMVMLDSLRIGNKLPVVNDLSTGTVEELVAWFVHALSDHVSSLVPGTIESSSVALKRTLKELEVEAPTHWELTLDLTATPVWREILEQLRQRSQFKKERVLVFTPEGAKALPSGLPVAWAANEISSQKHVLIACEWPRPDETVHVRARHMYAQQSCAKLQRPFWD